MIFKKFVAVFYGPNIKSENVPKLLKENEIHYSNVGQKGIAKPQGALEI